MKTMTENLKFINEFPDKAGDLAKRLHVKKDEIPFVRKYYTSEKQEADKKERSVISYISTGAIDRDGEKLLPEGVNLENYKKNPIVMMGHDYKAMPIGKNIWIKKDDKGLIAKTAFAKSERGDEMLRACTEDINGTGPLLQGWSVGFIPIEWEDVETKDKTGRPDRIYKKWELLEYSVVPIPSCPEALTIAVEKGLISERLKKELEIELIKDKEIEISVTKDKEIGLTREADDQKEKERKEEKAKTAGTKEEKVEVAEGRQLKEPEYKERWNKSLSKVFDVASVQAPIATFNYALYEKFLECKVKDIFLNGYSIPSPLLGTYLAGFKEVLSEFKLKDTRSFTWDGLETPPQSEVIKLNSKKSDDFVINGTCFYDAGSKPLIVKYASNWSGIEVSIVTASDNKEWNKDLLDKVHDWVHENNYLRGEKFALSGEFLDEPGDSWDNLILDSKYKDPIIKSANFLEKKGADLTGRGLLFVGPPGTGKTKTGRVLMNELDATFIWVSSRDFRHANPLTALSLGFSLARDLAPSILFLEDIDTWLGGYVTDLVKTEMDGIKQNKGLITVMTSNYPEKLPDALLDRPGRFHHIINFELPGEKQRRELIRMLIKEKHPDKLKGLISVEVIEKTEGFSGAHIKELIEFAAMIAEEDDIEIEEALLKSLDKLIKQRELIDEIRSNKVEAKAIWGKLKWVDSDVVVGVHKDDIKLIREANAIFDKTQYKGHADASAYNPDDESVTDNLSANIKITDMPEFKTIISDLKSEIIELKEGRVLSAKNRTLVKDTIEALAVLKERLDTLYAATEPVSRTEEERTAIIETEKQFVVEKDGAAVSADDMIAKKVAEAMSGENLMALMKKSVDAAIDTALKTTMGKVE